MWKKILLSPYFIIGIISLSIIGYLSIMVYTLRKRIDSIPAISTNQNNKIGEADIVIGDLHNKIVSLESDLQKKVKDLNASLDTIVGLKFQLQSSNKEVVNPTTKVVWKDKEVIVKVPIDIEPGKLFTKSQDGKIHEITSMKVSYKDFRIDIDAEALSKTVEYNLHQKFSLKIVKIKKENSSGYLANLSEIDNTGKIVSTGKIDSFEVSEVPAEKLTKKMFWWNPKLDIGIAGLFNLSQATWGADVGISIATYGLTKDDVSWKFGRVGIGINKDTNAYINIVPAQYNIAKHLPLVSNIFVGPSYNFIPNGSSFIGVNIGAIL